MTYYVFWSKFVLVELIPYVSILVLNCAIILKIFKAAHFRKKFTDDNNDCDVGGNHHHQRSDSQRNSATGE